MISSLKIVELSTVLAGPAVGMFFAELGATVKKFEHPSVPDVTRSWKLSSEAADSNISAYFSSVNYRKHYLQVDLATPGGKIAILQELEDADIVLLNFKKGDDRKFGLTTEELHALNPSLIIGKISGFGETSDRVAYDLILQAETGFMSMNGTPESGPVKMPVALIDVLAAHQLKEGILVALLNRTATGKGSEVSVSLYDAAVCSLVNQASNYLMENHIPKRIGSLHPNIAPYGELFTTNDRKLVTFAIGSNTHFSKLCSFLGASDLSSDERFAQNVSRVKNRELLQGLLQKQIVQLTASELQEAMNAVFVPMGIVRSLDEVFEDEEAKALVREEEIDKKNTKRVTSIAFKLQ